MSASYDAIVSLGGGSQRGPSPASLPKHVLRRLELAAHLFHRSTDHVNKMVKKNQKDAVQDEEEDGGAKEVNANSSKKAPFPPQIIALSAGTPHRPNFTDPSSGFAILESTSAAAYLSMPHIAGHGIPAERVWREQTSLDTIGNAFFLLTSFLAPAAPGRFRTIAVITSEFHMPRTRAIFDWMLMTEPAAAAAAADKDDTTSFTMAGADEKQDKAPSGVFPFSAKLFGTSTSSSSSSSRSRNEGEGPQESQSNSGFFPLFDRVDYYSVSDENTQSSEQLLQQRIEREKESLAAFRRGICEKLKPLRESGARREFLAAVQDFVLTDHRAYSCSPTMLSFPAREVWEANETY